jgi:hypothetical protein
MTEDASDRTHAFDAPWRDVPADSDVISGTEEPDPAEVVGDDGTERDLASRQLDEPRDSYHRDTLDERLAEEEPEAILRGRPDTEAGQMQAPELGGDDVVLGEADTDPDNDPEELSAEDAAVHLREE